MEKKNQSIRIRRRQFLQIGSTFAATGLGPKEWDFEKTWNMVIPLKS